MLSETMFKTLNEQVKWEFESSYLYLGMAAWLNDQALPGFAQWMREQAKEEIEHAMKLYKFIEERGNRVELLPIPAPAKEWKSVEDVVESSLNHEKKVTALINSLMDQAQSEKDHATAVFLQWFVSEQVEEEDMFRSLLEKVKLVKPTCSAILFLDKSLAKRGSE